jgi:glutathione peroxidase
MSVHQFSAKSIDGAATGLDDYAGKVLLVVNVASQCGLTPQYEGLEALYRKYRDRGLLVLGFPCDQFGHQEPGSEQDIKEFCSLNYDVSFPLFSKIEVNGPQAHPLYTYMRAEQPGIMTPDAETLRTNPLYQHLAANCPELLGTDAVKWNFTKFLVGRDGTVLKRFEPTVTPEQIEAEIEPLLN